jgi:predicted SAM-dependent methyltransferase
LSHDRRSVLSVGNGDSSLAAWEEQGYKVFSLDIDLSCKPDYVASMTDMGDIGPFDIVYCCHALEHLYPHMVLPAVKEMYRVIKDQGTAVIVVPDLEDVRPTNDLLPEIGLTGLHLFYGDGEAIKTNPHMAHHSGFVAKTLLEVLESAGFESSVQRKSHYNLVGIGIKCQR